MDASSPNSETNKFLIELRRISFQVNYRKVIFNDYEDSSSYSRYLRDLNDSMRLELQALIINNEIQRSFVFLKDLLKLIVQIETGLNDLIQTIHNSIESTITGSVHIDGSLIEKLNQYTSWETIPNNSVFIDKTVLSEVHDYLNLKVIHTGKVKQSINELIQDLKDSTKTTKDKEYLNSKQQILVLYFLHENKLINYYNIHKDAEKRYKVISALINRNESNTKKNLQKIFTVPPEQDEVYFNVKNLKKVFEVFNNAGVSEFAKEISRLIDIKNI